MVCSVCGGSDLLYPDPAGYFRHAFDEEGRPWMCTAEHGLVTIPEQQ